jgi:PAS domain S-box-containing protein
MNQAGTVLIVDDEKMILDYLEALLTTEGYQIALASNGFEALGKAEELTPDLVLLDVMMPEMDGFEVCRRLRATPRLAEVPIIMVTGLDDQKSRLEGIEAGANDFVTKPFNGAELRARVRTITRLNRHRQMRTLELRAERDRTHAILEALGEAVVVTDVDGRIRYLNPATVALTGYSDREALGQSWYLWQSTDDHKDLNDDILGVVRSGQTWQGEVVNRRKDGTTYDAALTVAPLFSSEDPSNPIGFVSVQRDITPLKEAERSKTKFVSNVSHELRTPLSVITLLGDNLDTLYDRLSDGKRREMIRDIQKHTEVLNNLIGDILEISRIDSGRASPERSQVDLAGLVREEANKLLPMAEQKFQTLDVLETEQLPIWGNDEQLRQVIRNLVNNAIKYTPEEGTIICECVSHSTLPPEQAQNSEDQSAGDDLSEADWAVVRVIDNGIGISQEHLPNLFARFYRVNTQGNIRGTGLGLSIARELTELHAGYLDVTSTPGEGSVFTVYLPMLARE